MNVTLIVVLLFEHVDHDKEKS